MYVNKKIFDKNLNIFIYTPSTKYGLKINPQQKHLFYIKKRYILITKIIKKKKSEGFVVKIYYIFY